MLDTPPREKTEDLNGGGAPPDNSGDGSYELVTLVGKPRRVLLVWLAAVVTVLTGYLVTLNWSAIPADFRAVVANEGFATAVVGLTYMSALMIARWQMIAWPYSIALNGDINSGLGRIKASPVSDDRTRAAEYLLKGAAAEVGASDGLFWSWGRQKAAAQLIAEADEVLAAELTPVEARHRLEIITAEIDRYAATDPGSVSLNQRIRSAQAAADRALDPEYCDGAQDEENGQHRRGLPSLGGKRRARSHQAALQLTDLHSNALRVLHRLELDEFARILKWHRKVLWLTFAGLLLGITLAAVLGGAIFLALGAAGAYLSRLTLIIRRADAQPEDTASYWTNLLLGPMLGALAAYGGVLLIVLLNQFDLLGPTLKDVSFVATGDAVWLARSLAFLFGMTEGLVNKVGSLGAARFFNRADPSDISAGVSRALTPR